jgi:hypothetical protein
LQPVEMATRGDRLFIQLPAGKKRRVEKEAVVLY